MLKARQRGCHQLRFIMSIQKYGWAIQKAYLYRPVKILHFLTPARVRKHLTYLQNILDFLTINHLQAESSILEGIFLHAIPFRIIARWLNQATGFVKTKKRFEGKATENPSLDCTRWFKNKYMLNTSYSFIDLIFTSQPNWTAESVVHLSLHRNCHHQIIYAKIN